MHAKISSHTMYELIPVLNNIHFPHFIRVWFYFNSNFVALRDLQSWINTMDALVASDELAKDVTGAEALLERHRVSFTKPKGSKLCRNLPYFRQVWYMIFFRTPEIAWMLYTSSYYRLTSKQLSLLGIPWCVARMQCKTHAPQQEAP